MERPSPPRNDRDAAFSGESRWLLIALLALLLVGGVSYRFLGYQGGLGDSRDLAAMSGDASRASGSSAGFRAIEPGSTATIGAAGERDGESEAERLSRGSTDLSEEETLDFEQTLEDFRQGPFNGPGRNDRAP